MGPIFARPLTPPLPQLLDAHFCRNFVLRAASELGAHEEERGFDILVLVGVEDVDVVLIDEEVDDGDDDAFAVRAVDEQDGGLGGGHGSRIPSTTVVDKCYAVGALDKRFLRN